MVMILLLLTILATTYCVIQFGINIHVLRERMNENERRIADLLKDNKKIKDKIDALELHQKSNKDTVKNEVNQVTDWFSEWMGDVDLD